MSIEDFLANLIKIRVNNAPSTPAEHYWQEQDDLGAIEMLI